MLDEPVGLPDGTDVEVEVRPVAEAEAEQGQTWGQVFRDVAGSVKGLPPDLAENHIRGAPKRADKP